MEATNGVIGAGVGLAAGVGTGAAIGAKQTSKMLLEHGMKGLTQDQYINSRIEANLDNIQKATQGKRSKIAEYTKKIVEKAKSDFTSITKSTKNTKNKWIAGLAAAGTAIGIGAAYLISKHSSNKEAVSQDALQTHQG